MRNTVKEIIYTVGDTTGAFARSLGHGTAGVARTVGHRTAKIARDIGPRRALIGVAILAAVVGGSIVVVRYLRRREQAELDASIAPGEVGGERASTKIGRAERRAMHTAQGTLR